MPVTQYVGNIKDTVKSAWEGMSVTLSYMFRRPMTVQYAGPEAAARQLGDETCWQLLLAASKSGSAIERAVASGEPSHVARYAFQLAQSFSNFYHEYPVLSEADREKKTFLLWMTDYFRAQLERTLGVLGIEVPEYM